MSQSSSAVGVALAPIDRRVAGVDPMVWSMRRAVIGICTALERARWSVWDQQAMLLPRSYVDAVQRAGALALLLPPDADEIEDPTQVLDLVDGLMLAGGADIDPGSYGEPTHSATAR